MAGSVDWYYRRNNCATCAKADAFLAKARLKARQTLDARKQRFEPADALALARAADRIIATRGKALITIDLTKDLPDDANLLKVLMGPSGNLRAPAIRIGRTLLIGFDAATYSSVLKP